MRMHKLVVDMIKLGSCQYPSHPHSYYKRRLVIIRLIQVCLFVHLSTESRNDDLITLCQESLFSTIRVRI